MPPAGHVSRVAVLGRLHEGELRHPPLVDEALQELPVPSSQLRGACHGGDGEAFPRLLRLSEERGLDQLIVGQGDPFGEPGRRQGKLHLVVGEQPEGDPRVRCRPVDEDGPAQPRLRADAPEELLSRRVVEEQLGDVDNGPLPALAGLEGFLPAADHLEPMRGILSADRAHHDQPAADGDAREGLPAETEAGDAQQVVLRLDLRGRVRLPAHREVLPPHAGAVVDDAHARETARFQIDVDGAAAGVDRIVEQLPQNGKRTVDHLAGRYLARNFVPKDMDPPGLRGENVHQRPTGAPS